MNKIFILLTALLISVSAFSQQELRRNEIKLNLSGLGTGLYPGISYERILHHSISVGASVGVLLNNSTNSIPNFYGDILEGYHFTPRFRWFFGGQRRAREMAGVGFFVETSGTLFYHHYVLPPLVWGNTSCPIRCSFYAFNWGISGGVGLKYLINNWIGEAMIGRGHNFHFGGYAYTRFSISIGRRF